MSITKESKEWVLALALIPEKWQAGRCKVTDVTCHHFDRPWFDPESEESKRWVKEGGEHPPFAEHDIPPPDITPDLLYAIRRAIEARGYTWVIRYTAGKNRSPNEAYSMTIFKDSTIVVHEDAATEDDAIIRAAANLQEAK